MEQDPLMPTAMTAQSIFSTEEVRQKVAQDSFEVKWLEKRERILHRQFSGFLK
jgi:hypothetical protein